MGSLDISLSPLVGILAVICFVMYLLDEAENYKRNNKGNGKKSTL